MILFARSAYDFVVSVVIGSLVLATAFHCPRRALARKCLKMFDVREPASVDMQ